MGMEVLDLKGRWTNGDRSYDATAPLPQEKIQVRGTKNFGAVAVKIHEARALAPGVPASTAHSLFKN
jgi:hypothetical protein